MHPKKSHHVQLRAKLAPAKRGSDMQYVSFTLCPTKSPGDEKLKSRQYVVFLSQPNSCFTRYKLVNISIKEAKVIPKERGHVFMSGLAQTFQNQKA